MRGHRDLVLVTGLAALCAALALLIPVDAVRAVFAIPLCLVLPGYAITAAAFPRRHLQPRQLATLSVGLSLCTLALGALLLDLVGGLHAGTWALLLVLLVAAPCWLAAIRRPRHDRRPAPTRLPRLSPAQGLVYATGVTGIAVAIGLAFVALPAKKAVGHTELWIDGGTRGDVSLVRVGVRSQEQRSASYFLRIRVGRDPQPLVRLFNLVPGERRLIRVSVPAPRRDTLTTASLFRQTDPEAVDRRVYTWLPGGEA